MNDKWGMIQKINACMSAPSTSSPAEISCSPISSSHIPPTGWERRSVWTIFSTLFTSLAFPSIALFGAGLVWRVVLRFGRCFRLPCWAYRWVCICGSCVCSRNAAAGQSMHRWGRLRGRGHRDREYSYWCLRWSCWDVPWLCVKKPWDWVVPASPIRAGTRFPHPRRRAGFGFWSTLVRCCSCRLSACPFCRLLERRHCGCPFLASRGALKASQVSWFSRSPSCFRGAARPSCRKIAIRSTHQPHFWSIFLAGRGKHSDFCLLPASAPTRPFPRLYAWSPKCQASCRRSTSHRLIGRILPAFPALGLRAACVLPVACCSRLASGRRVELL